VRRHRAAEAACGRSRKRQGRDAQLAEAIANRAVEELRARVRKGIRRNDHRGRGDAHMEIGREPRQHRLDRAERDAAVGAGERQKKYGFPHPVASIRLSRPSREMPWLISTGLKRYRPSGRGYFTVAPDSRTTLPHLS